MRRSSTGTDRLGRSLALLLALAAVVAVTTAWLIQHQSEERRAAVSDTVPRALTTTSRPVSRSLSPAKGASATRGATHNATHEASPASGRQSHVKRPVKPLVRPIAPTHLYVPGIGVNTTVAGRPTEMAMDHFIGKVVPSFGVPDDMYTTTWWSSGPKPGAPGMAVVLGHTQIGGYGVFNDLGKLKAGQVIGLSRGATVLKFAVISVHTGISKKDPNALANLLESHPAAARLALLTCSGTFNGSYRESEANTVVFARLVSVG